MKKVNHIVTVAFTVAALFATQACAADSTKNASDASKQAALASKSGVTASGQAASAVVAVPLVVSGAAGAVSTTVGTASLENASGKKEALPVTDVTVTADPAPKKVMPEKKKVDQ